jgi:hypothetical protein
VATRRGNDLELPRYHAARPSGELGGLARGYPQTPPYKWWNWHDNYNAEPSPNPKWVDNTTPSSRRCGKAGRGIESELKLKQPLRQFLRQTSVLEACSEELVSNTGTRDEEAKSIELLFDHRLFVMALTCQRAVLGKKLLV